MICSRTISAHHFADDRNLLLIDTSLRKINKHINNRDLKLAVDWIRATKLSLNASKTEIVSEII